MRSNTDVFEPDMIAHACNLRTQDSEAGGLLQEANLGYVRKTV